MARLARERCHTLYFLDYIRVISPVYIDTEIEMSRVEGHRTAERAEGHRFSVVSYVLYEAGRVLARHPAANSLIRGRLWPRVTVPDGVNAKLTLDKWFGDQRVVLATVLENVHLKSLAEIQGEVDHFRDGDPVRMPEFTSVRLLHRMPWFLGVLLFRLAVTSLRRRPHLFGTLAVTSLGHTAVDGFHSTGGTTVTLGVGRIVQRPIVNGDRIVPAPIMRLSLCFDHRVIDGAEAAEVLSEIRTALESFQGVLEEINPRFAS